MREDVLQLRQVWKFLLGTLWKFFHCHSEPVLLLDHTDQHRPPEDTGWKAGLHSSAGMTRKRTELMIKAQPTKVNWLEMRLRIRDMPPNYSTFPRSLALSAPKPLHIAAVRGQWISTPAASLGPGRLRPQITYPPIPTSPFSSPFAFFSLLCSFLLTLEAITPLPILQRGQTWSWFSCSAHRSVS